MTIEEERLDKDKLMVTAMSLIYRGQSDEAFRLVARWLGADLQSTEMKLELRRYRRATWRKAPEIAKSWLKRFITDFEQ